MTAKIIFGVDFRKHLNKPKTIEEQACELMDVIYRPEFYASDTAPAEYCAPDKDSA
jgi:hypothetical protein